MEGSIGNFKAGGNRDGSVDHGGESPSTRLIKWQSEMKANIITIIITYQADLNSSIS
jgi:hypothetical protein